MKSDSYFILEPVNTKVGDKDYYEQVLILDKNKYPVSLMHIDCFSDMYCFGSPTVYDQLRKGEKLIVAIEIREVMA